MPKASTASAYPFPSHSAQFQIFAPTAPGLESIAAGELKSLGVAEVFTPGAPTQAIVDFIREATARGRVSSS